MIIELLVLVFVVFGSVLVVISKMTKRKNKSIVLSPFEEISPFFDGFFKYVFVTLSKCPGRECSIKSPDICPKEGCCNSPTTLFAKTYGNTLLCKDESSRSDCNTINKKLPFAQIDYVLRNFEHLGLIQYRVGIYALSGAKEGNYYMLGGFKRLSWKNINDINKSDAQGFKEKYPDVYEYLRSLFEDTSKFSGDGEEEFDQVATYIRYIFWYFRKYVVDTMVSSSLLKHNVTGLSVGSTNITSDYDVTIYGDSYVNISAAIIEFNETFLKTFHEPSSDVFDTNLYGVSAINMVTEMKPPSSKLSHNTDKFATLFSPNVKTCGNKQFKYTNVDAKSEVSQHVWALVTVLMHLKDIEEFDSKIYAYLMNKLQFVCEGLNDQLGSNNFCNLLSVAEKFTNTYPINLGRYPEVVKSLENTKVDLNDFNNFISFVNYNGMETYVCRGTFLDVVVNQQMCQKKPTVVLSNEEYFDSFIENTACLLSHFRKTKYLDRVKYAFQNMKYLSQETDASVSKYLQAITNAQIVCNQEGSLLNCEPFIIMENCINIIIEMSQEILNSSSELIDKVEFIS